MQKKKKGISLIVLVITIIVMLILAATIIISLSNNEIIDKSHIAVEKTNEKQVEELANLAWGEAYAANMGKSEEQLLQALKESVEKILSDNNLDKEDYYINVTTSGVTIKNIDNVWIQKSDRTVVKGDKVLNIGDYVNYVSEVEGYTDTNGWQVLGAENGELLIMSANNVASKSFNGENTLEGGKKSYENGISELNEICAPYGKGTYATKARSITVEDVDRVTGYDKTKYNKGIISEYGNIVTYSYNGTNKPAYSGSNGVTGTLSDAHSSGFHWYDLNNVYNYVSASALTNEENNGKEIIKLTSTYYYCDASRSTDLQTVASDAYAMLFGSSDENDYWLGSAFVTTYSNYVSFGIRRVARGDLDGTNLFTSTGACAGRVRGVRAVVTLSSEYNP